MTRWWLTSVRGHSMAPALRDGQLALTGSVGPGSRVRRGDVVVAEVPDAGGRVVKRVVGLPGERVSLRGAAVLVDGIAIDEPYASASFFRGDFEVPPGHYLLLGDRRDASDDARSWPQPYVARRQLVGRLVRPRPGTLPAGSAEGPLRVVREHVASMAAPGVDAIDE